MKNYCFITTLTISTLSLLAGCTPLEIRCDLPQHFVEIDENNSDYAMHGVSADGLVLGCREKPNIKNGTVKFWMDAIKNNTIVRGYKLMVSEDFTTDLGQSGRLMKYNLKSEGTTFGYWLAVFVAEKKVYLVEAGGKLELMTSREEDIIKSMKSFR